MELVSDIIEDVSGGAIIVVVSVLIIDVESVVVEVSELLPHAVIATVTVRIANNFFIVIFFNGECDIVKTNEVFLLDNKLYELFSKTGSFLQSI